MPELNLTSYSMILLLALCINGYYDFNTKEVFPIITIIAGALGIWLAPLKIFAVLAIASALFVPDNARIGGGDVDALLLILSNPHYALLSVVIATVIAFIYKAKSKQKQIPYVFCLAIGYLFSIIIQFMKGI